MPSSTSKPGSTPNPDETMPSKTQMHPIGGNPGDPGPEGNFKSTDLHAMPYREKGDPAWDAVAGHGTEMHKVNINTGDPAADDDGDDPRSDWRDAVDDAHEELKNLGSPREFGQRTLGAKLAARGKILKD